LIQLTLSVDEPGLDADLRGSLLGPSATRNVSDARADLEQTIRGTVAGEFGRAEIQFWYAEGSVVVWVLVTLAGGVIQGAAWDAVRGIGSRLQDAVMRWFNRQFGSGFAMRVAYRTYVPTAQAPPSQRPRRSALTPEILVAVLALLAQSALIFVVVWLVVTN
jgi:hypothetical protein